MPNRLMPLGLGGLDTKLWFSLVRAYNINKV